MTDDDIDAATIWTARRLLLELMAMLGGCAGTEAAIEKLREARELLKTDDE